MAKKENNGASVFISHQRGGKGARPLHEALVARGVSSFLDEEMIDPGNPFPERLADAMLAARVVVAFMDDEYLKRPWCIYELRVATAPARADANAAMDHLVVALPAEGATTAITDRLPPASASQSWPNASNTEVLVALVEERLVACPDSLAKRLEGLDDDAGRSLRSGALVPAPTTPPGGKTLLTDMSDSLKERFVGRTGLLWMIHDALDPGGVELASRSCAIEGGGGTGKSQLAAEYVSRYGRYHYPGGCIWVDASGGDENLVRQLHTIARLFDKHTPAIDTLGERASDRVETLQQMLRECVPGDQRTLWVIDDVPEPGVGEQGPQPLQRWCPVRDRVALLCTSRRAGIKDADHHIAVHELCVEAATQLLTQAPVDSSWLAAESWERITRWLGCWPLGLRIAQASLADGYVTAKSLLKSALGEEPARALESEVDALREDVVEGYLHGVAEIFHDSYEALAKKPTACRHAHLLARLARAPLSEDALDTLIPAASRGLLAKRSWIDSTNSADGDGRHWTMHRVIASYLRCLSDAQGDPDAEFADLCGWLETLLTPETPLPPPLITRNLRVVIDGIHARLETNPSPTLVAAARNLALHAATWKLWDFELREPRYYAAALAETLGVNGELAQRLHEGLASADVTVARSCVAAAGGMAHSEEAAHFLLQAICDPRQEVRFQVAPTISQLAPATVLGVPLMQEIIARAEEWSENVRFQLDPLLENAEALPDVATLLFDALSNSEPPQRRFASAMFGRILAIYGDHLALEAKQQICQALLDVVLDDELADIAMAASEAMAAVGESMYPTLVEIIGSRAKLEDQRWRRAVDAFVVYCTTLERPPSPGFGWIVDDGESTCVPRNWPAAQRKPERLEPLARMAVNDTDPTVQEVACRALLGEVFGVRLPRSIITTSLIRGGFDCWIARFVIDAQAGDSGRAQLANQVNDAIDAGLGEKALPIAELAIAFDPEFSSPYWWRARIMQARGEYAAARDDYGHVFELSPTFVDAVFQRGYAHRCLGELEEALADYGLTLEIDPEFPDARYYRAEVLHLLNRDEEALADAEAAVRKTPDWDAVFELAAGVYGALQRWRPCLESATRAIELGCPPMPTRYYRALAYVNQGLPLSALDDLEVALAAQPDDARLTKLWRQLTSKPPPPALA